MDKIIDKTKITGIDHLPQVNRFIDIVNGKTTQESTFNEVIGAMLEASIDVIANLEERLISLEQQ